MGVARQRTARSKQLSFLFYRKPLTHAEILHKAKCRQKRLEQYNMKSKVEEEAPAQLCLDFTPIVFDAIYHAQISACLKTGIYSVIGYRLAHQGSRVFRDLVEIEIGTREEAFAHLFALRKKLQIDEFYQSNSVH